MAKNTKDEKQNMSSQLLSDPSTPPSYNAYVHRAPPPSYLESQQQYRGPQQEAYGYTNPYQAHMQQQQMYYQQQPPTGPFVQTLTKYAVTHSPLGALTVPPPPPGYTAMPVQVAAMHGVPVVLKKKKNTFF